MLIYKYKFYDGAEFSGSAIHCENLFCLYQLAQEQKYFTQAEDILKAAKSFIEAFPPGACYHLIALQRYLDEKAPLIVVALNHEREYEQELKQVLGAHFSPNSFLVWKSREDEVLNTLIPSIANQACLENKTTVHICRGTHCEAPLTEIDQILEAIEHL